LYDQHIVRFLGRFRPAKDRARRQLVRVALLARMDHQRHVAVALGGERAKGGNDRILLPVSVQMLRLVQHPHHKLQIIDDDVLDVVHVLCVLDRFHHDLDRLLAVERHEVDRQPLERIRPLLKLGKVLVQRSAHHLPEQRYGEPGVADFERAPKRRNALLCQIERVVRHEGGLATAGRSGQYGKLSLAMAFKQLVERRVAFPLDALHFVDVLQIAQHVLPQRAERRDGLVQDRLRFREDCLWFERTFQQRPVRRWMLIGRAHKQTPSLVQLLGVVTGRIPAGSVVVEPQR
uniref:Uncharacterized protein n=1 Tax=Anopheles coluzzii TaxID=1518534 RepID=A0A8W7P8M4_ANOCL